MSVLRFPGPKQPFGRKPPDAPSEVELFSFSGGSATSDDGEMGLLQAERADGSEIFLGFPQKQFPYLVEAAAREMGKARKDGQTKVSAFNCTGFAVNRTKLDEILLTICIGEEGQLNFLIPTDMPPALIEAMEIEIISDHDDA